MDLVLTPLGGEPRPLEEWLTTFHLATVALDPYTNESSWILPTATRVLEGLRGSDARVNFLVTADASDARAFLGPLVERFLVFTDPGPRRRQGARAQRAAGLRVRPRRRHGAVRRRGVERAVLAGCRRRHRRRDGVAPARHPRRRRPRPVPRVAGARLSARCSPTSRSSRSSTSCAEHSPAARERCSPRRPAPARRPSSRSPCSTSRGSTGRRIVVLEPRRLATRAAARRMADAHGDRRRRTRRLPDQGRAPHRPADPRRGGHRGCPHPPPAARSRAARRRARRLRRGPRAQPHHRPRPRPDARRGGDAAPGPAHPRHVGHRRHRPASLACSATPRSSESAGQTHPVDIRWRPRTRDDRIEPAVVSAVLTRAARRAG